MKMTRFLGVLMILAMFAPMVSFGQEAAPPNATVVAVTEAVTKAATDKAVEVTKEATAAVSAVLTENAPSVTEKALATVKDVAVTVTDGAKEAVADAVAALTPSASAKGKMLDALLGFLDVGKNALEGGALAVGKGVGVMADGAVAAGKFAGTQIPLVLNELIMLRRVEVLIKFLATFGIGLIVFVAGRKFWKWINDPENKELKGSQAEGSFTLIAILMQIAALLMPIIIFCTNMREWILPWAAPRIYLIEYTVQLIEKLQLADKI